jgi:hypothetical protein
MKPYTYLIKHKPTNTVYYGVRSANKEEPHKDLWNTYFTSSPKVKQLIEETGIESFEVKVRRVFKTKEDAIKWEAKVLRRCKVLQDERWINQNVAGYIIPTKESNKKISEFHKGKPKTEEHKKNMSLAQKGKPKKSTVYQSEAYRSNMSKIKSGAGNARYGVIVSDETRKNISKAKKGKPAKNKGIPMIAEQKAKISAAKLANAVYITCEHCGKTCIEKMHKRFHGTRCRSLRPA